MRPSAGGYTGEGCPDRPPSILDIHWNTASNALISKDAYGLPKAVPDDVELMLVRLADGAILAELKGEYWDAGESHANREDEWAAWSATAAWRSSSTMITGR